MKKYIALILAVSLVSSSMPLSIFAEEIDNTTSISQENEEVTEISSEMSATDETEEKESETSADVLVEEDNTVDDNVHEILPDEVIIPQPNEEMFFEISFLGAGETDTAGIAFANDFETVLSNAGIASTSYTIDKNSSPVTLHINDSVGAKILSLLSNQTQSNESNYQNWKISFDFTGTIALGDDFAGLGDNNYPFTGEFSGQGIVISTYKTLFKALGSNALLNGQSIQWIAADASNRTTASEDYTLSPILAKILVADSADHTIGISLSSSDALSPFIGKLIGENGLVTLPKLDYSNASAISGYSGNVALLCCEMGNGTKLKTGTSVILPASGIEIGGSACVGGFVGIMGENSELVINSETNPLSLNVVLSGGTISGGLVGKMSECAKISGSLALNSEITGSGCLGGIIGEVNSSESIYEDGTNISLNSAKLSGSGFLGGCYGIYVTSNSNFNPLSNVKISCTPEFAQGDCGAVIGKLELSDEGKCIISGSESELIQINSKVAKDVNSLGGIIGTLEGASAKNVLKLSYVKVYSDYSINTGVAGYGGVVHKQSISTIDLNNSSVTVEISTNKIGSKNFAFGGVVREVGNNALLLVDNVKIETTNYQGIISGGGIAAKTGKGSIVWLKNTVDLYDCTLTTNKYTGQIIGMQDCSLIYAPNATITRYKSGMELDDIANYGEIYRIPDFITVNSDYTVSLTHQLTYSASGCEFNNEYDYACFALAWQSQGYFASVLNINNSNWTNLCSATINLKSDINMTGMGIGGLTRSNRSNDAELGLTKTDELFNGKLLGNNHTLTIDIGGKNSVNDVKGDGSLHRRGAIGLFARLSSSATIKDVTIAGSIRFQNNGDAGSSTSVGVLAGEFNCAADSKDPLSNVSINISVTTFLESANGDGVKLFEGGLIGLVLGGKQTKITLDGNYHVENTITRYEKKYHYGERYQVGGIIGVIFNDCKDITVECKGAKISGKIDFQISDENTTEYINNVYCGSLIGNVLKNTKSNILKKVIINGLEIKDMTISSNAKQRMGGMLGGSWADTNVNIIDLKISDSKLNCSNKAQLGGLVYRAEGKWEIEKADLSGLTISAPQSTVLGIFVCKGGPGKETVNATSTAFEGLYLVTKTDWADNYLVPTVNDFTGSVFDEFIAYTGNEENNYDVTDNGCGVISLKSTGDKINMTSGVQNTYVNRTGVGKTKRTNTYSRYYYNLPTVLTSCGGGDINTPQELLMWTVYRYASNNIKEYFDSDYLTENTGIIGNNSSTSIATIDLDGYSYYPINLTNSSIQIKNASIILHNKEIEDKEKEKDNKSTRGKDTNHTQHYLMHCGLFNNYTAAYETEESIPSGASMTMTLENVSFSGTIGVVNGGSGALICGDVHGVIRGAKTVAPLIILGSSDAENKGVILNNISVDSIEHKTPLLINMASNNVGIKARYIKASNYTGGTAVASSLIGAVGKDNTSTNIVLDFGGTIKLPDKPVNDSSDPGIFTESTLIKSLRYNSGSAVYNFPKSKDWDDTTHVYNVTYGKEINISKEYGTKEGYYYNGGSNRPFVSANGSFASLNDFSGYLPYIAESPAINDNDFAISNGWHEFAVNILVINLMEGCGTYGHPYVVSAEHLALITEFSKDTIQLSEGLKIRMKTDSEYHTDEDAHDKVYIYDSSEDKSWRLENALDDDSQAKTMEEMREYILKAYYVIEEDQTLDNFIGLGSVKYPFKGVIYGKKSVKLTMTGSSPNLINYSFGVVVKNVNIERTKTLNIELNGELLSSEARKTPEAFFGGVIGCVLGGDNIIDNVTVNISSDCITTSGEKGHLIPVGGFIGAIAGGGVIFRGNCGTTSGITGKVNELYRNPTIGRVLDGYAFYEAACTVPNNTNKNYTINQITSSSAAPGFTWDKTNNKLTIMNGEGLLLLSSLVSSGGAYINTCAYDGAYVRTAAYSNMGEATQPDDYAEACKDELGAWNKREEGKYNTPYILYMYIGYNNTYGILTTSDTGIQLVFASDCDMSGYGNGYRALSARYTSNAAFVGSTVKPAAVVMRIANVNGNNYYVQNVDMHVKEYADDNYHAVSAGGIFNIAWTTKDAGGNANTGLFANDLTIKKCNVSIRYYDNNGVEQTQADLATFTARDGRTAVAVGGFAGQIIDLGDISKKSKNKNYLLENLRIEGDIENIVNYTIYGPYSAGGLIGVTCKASQALTGYPGVLVRNEATSFCWFVPSFLNCSFSFINVEATLAAGGLVGENTASTNNKMDTSDFHKDSLYYGEIGKNNINNNISFVIASTSTAGKDYFLVGEHSQIKTTRQGAMIGGLFAGSGCGVYVNDSETAKNITSLISSCDIVTMKMENVDIQSWCKENYTLLAEDGSNKINGGYGGNGITSVGGVVGRLGGQNHSNIVGIVFENCNIEQMVYDKGYHSAESRVGGIVGGVAIGGVNYSLSIDNCRYINSNILSTYFVGGYIGCSDGVKIILNNCSFENSYIIGYAAQNSNWNNSVEVGGVIGRTNNTQANINNIAFKDTLILSTKLSSNKIVNNNNFLGLLVGKNNSTNYVNNGTIQFRYFLYAAGVSYYFTEKTKLEPNVNDLQELLQPLYYKKNWANYDIGSTNPSFPTKVYNNVDYSYFYMALTDYICNNSEVKDNKYPYVICNPNYELTGANKTLYGDAVGKIEGDTNNSVALRIWQDNSDDVTEPANYFKYTNINSIVENEEKPIVSDFYTEQGCGPTELPVLIVDSKTGKQVIENYLNVITNGGYSVALDVDKVTLTAETYYYENGKFSKANSKQLKEHAQAITINNNTMVLTPNAYDNTLSRFTLIEATFKTDVNEQKYVVSIPVIVKRQLQYNFMSTFTYGTEFEFLFYKELTNHVLEGAGSPVTALLTYQYNRDETTYVDYDWQSYIDGGGSTMSIDKKLIFTSVQKFPAGTTFTIVNKQENNKAYQYSLSSETNQIKLSDFVSVTDPSVQLLSNLEVALGITADTSSEGIFIAGTKDDASVRIWDNINGEYMYYRLATDDELKDSNIDKYNINVPEHSLTNTPEESYYLIINVPKQTNPEFYLNGNLKSKIDWTIPSKDHWVHRKDSTTTNIGSNDETSYQISTGYKQNLVSPSNPSKIDVSTGQMQIKVKDTITYSNRQIYGDSDQLYFKLNADLSRKEKDVSDSETVLLPAGTTGVAKFYISDNNGNYYNIDGEQVSADTAAASYSWIANGLGTELILSNDGITPLSLAKVRNAIKGTKEDGESEIIIDVVMGINFASTEVMNSVVPASQNGGTDEWLEFHYTSGISAQQASLTNTTARASVADNVGYYRSASFEANLTMDANSINQLGINPLELVPEYETTWEGKQASKIGIVSALNLANLQNLAGVLSRTNSITFTLTLNRGGRGTYNSEVSDAVNYIDFDLSAYGSDSFSWTISKDMFYDTENSKIKTSDIFDGVQFTMPFDAYVFTDQKNYANYKIMLTATFNMSDSTNITINADEAYLIYTFACIKPEYFDPELSGS